MRTIIHVFAKMCSDLHSFYYIFLRSVKYSSPNHSTLLDDILDRMISSRSEYIFHRMLSFHTLPQHQQREGSRNMPVWILV
nr:MAG TPA: hypothetical protein [Bacteriophage sp.]